MGRTDSSALSTGGDDTRAVWRLSLAIALLGVALTGMVSWFMWEEGRQEKERQLANQGQLLADSVDRALDEVVDRLTGIASFYRANEDVSAESFRLYTENLHSIPGMRGLGYIPMVAPRDLADHEAEISQTLPGYHVFEIDDTGNRVPASLRWFHAPVQWFEPADDPARPHGFDNASEPNRWTAMRKAIDASGVAVTGFISLVDERAEESFLVYLPVTDPETGRVVGFSVAPMELSALLDGQVRPTLAAQIDWEIESVPRHTVAPTASEDRWATVMDVGNQWWQLTVTWNESADLAGSATNLNLVAFAGLSASLLAAGGFYQYRRRREAQSEVGQLQSLARAKDQFLASVSHELRTPLTGVLGFAELLRDEQADLSDHERRTMITNVAQEATDLASIIDDLLVAARSELDLLAITRVPVSLRAQVHQVVETLSDAIRPSLEIKANGGVSAVG
ncbi:MAG TPA: CHASE domain-containing protein, partial [Acidimicrobiia bacterium]|nr:CHASE domain-containing protein [Acidimicrobiia bacterium]